jgi:outer membrane protein OmpA-like peptidoglycan-associated protein
MSCDYVERVLSCLMVCGLVGFGVMGCAPHEPPALTQLYHARDAMDAAKDTGAHDRYPDEYAALEQRYLTARGVFYACQDDKALALATALMADAQALGAQQAAAPTPTMVTPANQVPRAALRVPAEGNINDLLRFDATGSVDPDGDPLTYTWDFGDGSRDTFTFGVGTHRYSAIGRYPVRVTVDDGKGGSDTAEGVITIVSKQILSGDVLFDSNQATLKPAGIEALENIVAMLRDHPTYRAELVGHTDARGAAEYNMRLSKQRTMAVAAYLQRQGIAQDRLILTWKGETAPIAPNSTPDGRAKNRRTDITLRPPRVQ